MIFPFAHLVQAVTQYWVNCIKSLKWLLNTYTIHWARLWMSKRQQILSASVLSMKTNHLINAWVCGVCFSGWNYVLEDSVHRAWTQSHLQMNSFLLHQAIFFMLLVHKKCFQTWFLHAHILARAVLLSKVESVTEPGGWQDFSGDLSQGLRKLQRSAKVQQWGNVHTWHTHTLKCSFMESKTEGHAPKPQHPTPALYSCLSVPSAC